MADNKTKETGEDVGAFIDGVPDEKRRSDARALCALMEAATGQKPRMWGSSIVGFGRYRYRYESGREGEASPVGFSPRAKELVVYLAVPSDRTEGLFARLGKHRTGKSCVYIKSLADVDCDVLVELVADTYGATKERYPD